VEGEGEKCSIGIHNEARLMIILKIHKAQRSVCKIELRATVATTSGSFSSRKSMSKRGSSGRSVCKVQSKQTKEYAELLSLSQLLKLFIRK